MKSFIKRQRAMMVGHPEPWTLFPEWQGGKACSGRLASALIRILIPLSVAFVLSGFLLSTGEFTDGPQAYLGLGFLALLSLSVVPGLIELWRYLRWGPSELVFHTFPVQPGQQLSATLHTRIPAHRLDMGLGEFGWRLLCLEEFSSVGGRGSTGRRERVLWNGTGHASPERDSGEAELPGGRVAVPLLIPIPAEQPPTSTAPESRRRYWRLEIGTKELQPSFRAQFRVPVFDTRSGAERAGELSTALSEAAEGDPTAPHHAATAYGGDPLVAEATVDPVQLGQLRREADPRPRAARLFKSWRPAARIYTNTEGRLEVLNLYGDLEARRMRMILGAALLLAGLGAGLLVALVASVVFFALARLARPVTVRMIFEPEALVIHRSRGPIKKEKTKTVQVPWQEIGRAWAFPAVLTYHDILLTRIAGSGVRCGLRLPEAKTAEQLVGAIDHHCGR